MGMTQTVRVRSLRYYQQEKFNVFIVSIDDDDDEGEDDAKAQSSSVGAQAKTPTDDDDDGDSQSKTSILATYKRFNCLQWSAIMT